MPKRTVHFLMIPINNLRRLMGKNSYKPFFNIKLTISMFNDIITFGLICLGGRYGRRSYFKKFY